MGIAIATKKFYKVIKQLLNVASKDTYIELLTCLYYDKEMKTFSATDGFRLLIANAEELEEASGLETGCYQAGLGSLGKQKIVQLDKKEFTTKYPDLLQVIKKDAEVLVSFGISAHLLTSLIANSENELYITLYKEENQDTKKTVSCLIDLKFKVEGVPMHAGIMPLFVNASTEKWSSV